MMDIRAHSNFLLSRDPDLIEKLAAAASRYLQTAPDGTVHFDEADENRLREDIATTFAAAISATLQGSIAEIGEDLGRLLSAFHAVQAQPDAFVSTLLERIAPETLQAREILASVPHAGNA